MIKKTCLAIGVAIALVSSPVVGAEINKKVNAEFCKYQAEMITFLMQKFVGRKHLESTLGDKFEETQKASRSGRAEDIRRHEMSKKWWEDNQKKYADLEKLISEFATRWSVFCK